MDCGSPAAAFPRPALLAVAHLSPLAPLSPLVRPPAPGRSPLGPRPALLPGANPKTTPIPLKPHQQGQPPHATPQSPSSLAIWSNEKLATVRAQAGVTAASKAAALHQGHNEATGTSP